MRPDLEMAAWTCLWYSPVVCMSLFSLSISTLLKRSGFDWWSELEPASLVRVFLVRRFWRAVDASGLKACRALPPDGSAA